MGLGAGGVGEGFGGRRGGLWGRGGEVGERGGPMNKGDGTAGLDREYHHGASQDAQDGIGGDVEADNVAAAGASAKQRRAQRRTDNIPEGNHRPIPR